jgi:hypothetical protein
MASPLQLAQTTCQYRINAAHQQTPSDREQPIEAPQLAYTLNLEGTYTLSDFKVDPGNTYEIDCSAEQSAPHVLAHVMDSLI